jgi:hypothetical protein
MPTEQVRGKLIHIDGSTIASGLDIELEINDSPDFGQPPWLGSFVAGFTAESAVDDPAPCRLLLDDGRSGDVIIHESNMTLLGCAMVVWGTGPLESA